MWSGALRLRPIKREQRVQEPLGLAERQAEDDPQGQRGPDREVRVPPLASAKTVLRWYPRGNCILAQPDRDVAAAPEATLVLPPVPDSVLRLVLAVDSARLRCDHDVTPPISMMDWTPPPPLACSLTPIHAPTPEIRIGRVKATIWRNGTDEQPRHNVTFSRLYKDGDQWKSTQSFGRNDLLVLAKVADFAHTRLFQLPAEAELPEVQVDES